MPARIPVFCGSYRQIAVQLAGTIHRERQGQNSLDGPVEVMIASRGVADGVVSELLRLFPQGVTGIRLHSPDALALRIVNLRQRFPRVANARDRRLAMLAATAGQEDINTTGLAVMMERSYRDLRDSGVTLPEFSRHRDRFADRARVSRLIETWRRYEATVSRTAAIDPADLFHHAIELLGESEIPAQIVFGFYDMTGIQEMFLRALHRAGKVASFYAPVCDGSEYGFARRHLGEIEKFGVDTRGTPRACPYAVSISRPSTPWNEVLETCRSIRSLIDGGTDPRRIGIVSRTFEPQSVALLARAASWFDLPLALPSIRPLASHPFGRTIRLLLEIREHRFPRATVVELAGAPLKRDFWGFSFRSDRLDRATRRAEIAGGPSSWVKSTLRRVENEHSHDLEDVTNYIRVLDRLEKFTEPLTTARRGARWAETLQSLADSFRVDDDQDLAALQSVLDLAEICRRTDPSGASFDAAAILHLLETADALPVGDGGTGRRGDGEKDAETIPGLPIPPSPRRPVSPSPRPPVPPSVWVGDVMKARGRSFEHLFVLEVRDGAFPQGRAEDPLLPNGDRRIAGVREISDGRDEERLLFQLLIDATDHIHFSYPASDGVRRVFYASQFLKEFAQSRETDPDLKLLAIRNFTKYIEQVQPKPAPAKTQLENELNELIRPLSPSLPRSLAPSLAQRLQLLRLAGTRSSHDTYVDLSTALREVIEAKFAQISPTQFEYFGQCPQRFLFTTLLGIGEIEDPDHQLQIDIRKKGGLDHRILEVFYRSLVESDYAVIARDESVPPHLRQGLYRVIDQEFDRHEADYPAPNQMIREVERKITRKFLWEFVREDLLDMAQTDFRPAHFEYQFGKTSRDTRDPDHEAVTLFFGTRPVTIRGKIDRIDRNGRTGDLRVVDYKSGKGVRYKDLAEQTATGRALQLAFYALAAGQIFNVPADKIRAVIKPLRQPEPEANPGFVLSEVAVQLNAALSRFAEAISAGQFPAFPGSYCRWCAMGDWCRVAHDPREKHALEQFNSALDLLQQVPGSEFRVPGTNDSETVLGTRNPEPGTVETP